MKIKFNIDYRGTLTNERYFRAGETWAECPDGTAVLLIERGIAQEIKVKTVKPPRVGKKTTRKRS